MIEKRRQGCRPRVISNKGTTTAFHLACWYSFIIASTHGFSVSNPAISSPRCRGCETHPKRSSRSIPISPQRGILRTTTTTTTLHGTTSEDEGEDERSLEETPRSKNFRLQVFKQLNRPIVEVISVLAVLSSVLLVALSTLDDLSDVAYEIINQELFALNLIFALDFFVRWYAAGQFKPIYLTKPLVVLDIIVVILPLFLGSAIGPLLDSLGVQGEMVAYLYGLKNSAGLQNLLLLRVLRLRRVLTDINTFKKFVVSLGLKPQDVRPYQLQLARVLVSIFTLLSVASGLIYTAEKDVNPNIPDYFAALYFGLTTLTTVGFGDIVPVTSQGRLVVAGSIMAGIAVIPTQAAKLVDIFIESQKDLGDTRSKRRRQQPPPAFAVAKNNAISVQSAMNGQGPSGVSIDIPRKEDKMEEPTRGMAGRVCDQCGASSHRLDAAFCWSCGSKLLL